MNKTALITGASGGIGYEFSKLFAKNGYNVILVARNEKKLKKIKEELESVYNINALIIPKDLTHENAAFEVFDVVKSNNISVDFLINNAGFGDYDTFLDSDLKKQRDMVMLNIEALIEMTHLFGNEMKKRKSGRILNVASVAAMCAGPYMSVYFASKAFVLSFSQALSIELKESGITVTALCLGPASTSFEQASNMVGRSNMFKAMKPVSAKDVAEYGYKCLMKGKTFAYFKLSTKLINVASKLAPRALSAHFAKKVNGIP